MKKTLLERLTTLGSMTASEKKLAHFFEQMHTSLAFENLLSISQKVGVGKTTVTRFVVRLGYPDFHTFLRQIKDEAAVILDTPLKRYSKTKTQKQLSQPGNHLLAVQENLKYTLEQLSIQDFNRAVHLLADTKRPLYLIGCATAEPLVAYFYLLLTYLRDNIILLDGNAPTIAHRAGKIDKNAVLFSFAFNRYPKLTNSIMEYFSKKGADIIFLTDRHTSPMLHHAKTKLVIHSEGSSMFKTRCTALAIMEALLFEVTTIVGDQIPKRYENRSDIMRHLDIYIHE
ncbi:MAG: MurR/RpiR family transcriptional regulator [Saezia sp.]